MLKCTFGAGLVEFRDKILNCDGHTCHCDVGFTTNIPVRVIEDVYHGDITLYEHPDVRLHHHEYDARDGYKYHDPYVYC